MNNDLLDSNIFINTLSKLNMENNSSLVLAKDNPSDSYMKFHLEESVPYSPDAIYFKQFKDKPSIPQIYIYDYTKLEHINNEDITSLHKRLWNSCKVPLLFIITKTEIKIFNCYEKPTLDQYGEVIDITPLETIELASTVVEEFQQFNANQFDTGNFWESRYALNFKHNQTAYESLLKELDSLRKSLLVNSVLKKRTAESLLIKSILLKYLEERDVFEQGYWSKFKVGANSLIDLFDDNNAITELFKDLSIHFNGGVFYFTDDELAEIQNNDLSEFKLFLQGNKSGKYLHLWKLYSFQDLPVELISNIYELFLSNKQGVVYTPPILVNFIVDEVLPLDTSNYSNEYKIFDPACGSGIFLVSAFNRLIQLWRKENEWAKPSLKTLKQILKDNIFGIDIEEESVQLTIFSLALTLCDALSPEVIWNNLKFDNLEVTGNIAKKDFFEVIEDVRVHNKFNLIIGNPPFIERLTSKAAKEVNKKFLNDRRLPQNQLAYLFLECSPILLKKSGLFALIQPSGLLYNYQTDEYKKLLFSNYALRQVIDFSGVKNLFTTANVVISVLFFQNVKPKIDKDKTLHITLRQTKIVREKLYFEINHYDMHWLKYHEVIHNQYVWKNNLLGGGRTKQVVNRFKGYRTLKKFLSSKENDGWIYQEGFIAGKVHSADFITNKPLLPASAFVEDGINRNKIYLEKNEKFHRVRDSRIYQPPHILIKEQISKKGIFVEYFDEYMTFKNTIIGLHAPRKDAKELKKLEETLKENSLQASFYILTTSGRVGIYKATSTLLVDIENIPYPEDKNELKLSHSESIVVNDTMEYMFDLVKGNKDIKVLENASRSDINNFQDEYCNSLNSIYKNFNKYKIFETESFYVVSFYYGEKPNELNFDFTSDDQLEGSLKKLVYRLEENIFIKKILRLYFKNIVIFIKVKQLRFWLKSIALRDADETLLDLVKMGY